LSYYTIVIVISLSLQLQHREKMFHSRGNIDEFTVLVEWSPCRHHCTDTAHNTGNFLLNIVTAADSLASAKSRLVCLIRHLGLHVGHAPSASDVWSYYHVALYQLDDYYYCTLAQVQW